MSAALGVVLIGLVGLVVGSSARLTVARRENSGWIPTVLASGAGAFVGAVTGGQLVGDFEAATLLWYLGFSVLGGIVGVIAEQTIAARRG